ncbi:MAG: hypothetical protein FD124_615 [Alphaproteobacteria bacterium]|nr:MAG: hypothetical protein FD160_3100 [Caulobacteraceae bacterium]TPW08154.1 MAG: hypothetical protein FD124_615 [Alphaproteobacteria bacterium]
MALGPAAARKMRDAKHDARRDFTPHRNDRFTGTSRTGVSSGAPGPSSGLGMACFQSLRAGTRPRCPAWARRLRQLVHDDGFAASAGALPRMLVFRGDGGNRRVSGGRRRTWLRRIRDERAPLEQFPTKWAPVRRQKMRSNKKLEPRSDSTGSEMALALSDRTGTARSEKSAYPGLQDFVLRSVQFGLTVESDSDGRQTSMVPVRGGC